MSDKPKVKMLDKKKVIRLVRWMGSLLESKLESKMVEK